jgi:hypothetical protein
MSKSFVLVTGKLENEIEKDENGKTINKTQRIKRPQ